ncbi:MAG TPA: putative glycoside hydrolase, partial [Minicystis sp.]|nr:putative glycoside hydrolase [Minicystis sp.]
DSASPDLLQWEANTPPDPRLQGTGVRDNAIPELGGKTYIQAWQDWIAALDARMRHDGIALIPNDGSFVTTWDTTDYTLTAGAFSEGYADPSFAEADWKRATNQLLAFAAKGKIVILQNYLGSPDDVATRRYYLANYLLVKGDKTYLDYFASGPLEWYPEWALDFGAPATTGATVDDLAKGGVYRRDFANGIVLVNPSPSAVDVALGGTYQRVVPTGGGAVAGAGSAPGSLSMQPVTSITVPATGAELLMK